MPHVGHRGHHRGHRVMTAPLSSLYLNAANRPSTAYRAPPQQAMHARTSVFFLGAFSIADSDSATWRSLSVLLVFVSSNSTILRIERCPGC